MIYPRIFCYDLLIKPKWLGNMTSVYFFDSQSLRRDELNFLTIDLERRDATLQNKTSAAFVSHCVQKIHTHVYSTTKK